ncbi:Gfo/Idh/MocA family oxidoreductase [Hydrogenophaga sp.]|uniref:Gfo/Idh/MocA family protein n=1 Tax=Hydrogenophaga sp. TaxID=1904254 RepID=UPI002611CC68|nr:Gfo/Idh/MocA family oxidoreductase [Hydrogenophaga sp.]MCW5655643.1 Gfo/Idh/MocA family oxidoreductase [Hydrogenophaga sp.]
MSRRYRIGLIGAGRIGQLHGRIIGQHPSCTLALVQDDEPAMAQALAELHGGRAVATADDILGDPAIDAVVVASRTETHCDLIAACVAAGKPVLCEKPIDLSLARVRDCHEQIKDRPSLVQLGFNRRYDDNFIALRRAIEAGEVGAVESMHIITRVPTPPPYRYVRESGGLFRDMTIHDFDLARFLLGADPVGVFAHGAALIDPGLAAEGDVDSAMVLMGFADGSAVHVTNSRRCVYGLDHRVEVFGSEGMLSLQNGLGAPLLRSDRRGTARAPLHHESPITGYLRSFVNQWSAFLEALQTRVVTGAGFADGWNALAIAQAAVDSMATRCAVDPQPSYAPQSRLSVR